MDASHTTPSATDVAAEVGSLSTGLGILTFTFFPFALPLLILTFGPLLPLAVAGLLLAAPFVLPVWLWRLARRRRSRARGATDRVAGAARTGPRVSPPARAGS
jgi:membrane protein implicated in regulation of membrane protease activity